MKLASLNLLVRDKNTQTSISWQLIYHSRYRDFLAFKMFESYDLIFSFFSLSKYTGKPSGKPYVQIQFLCQNSILYFSFKKNMNFFSIIVLKQNSN